MSSNFKAQSAIEYLMTYGWMLLVVAIVGGAIFSVVGDQSIESVNGFDSNDIDIRDFGVGESGLTFVMSDPIGQTEVRDIQVTGSGSGSTKYILDQDLSNNEVIHLPGVKSSDEEGELEIEITYDAGNLENLTTTGQLQGSLVLEESFYERELILNGLVGYWPLTQSFSSETEVYDVSGNNYHGDMRNGLEFVDDPEAGSVMEFISDYEQDILTDDVLLSDVDEITILVWMDRDGGRAISQRDSGDTSYQFQFWTSGSGVNSYWPQEGTGGNERSDIDLEDSVYSEWHLVSMSSRENILRASNNLSFAQLEKENDIVYPDGPVHIGSRREGFYFDGRMKDLMIFDRFLTEEEIETIYKGSIIDLE